MTHSVATNIILLIAALLCPAIFLGLLLGFIYATYSALREGIAQVRRLHQIPCDRCAYFTNCHLLKCTVHPHKALTEAACDCLDFEPASIQKSPSYSATTKNCSQIGA